jgi:NitT/TauT family transport system substrate-binding protein
MPFPWRVGVVCASALVLGGCGSSSKPDPASPDRAEPEAMMAVAVQLNWYPEAEHGGIYQAFAGGTYAEAGLDVDIRPGGRLTPVAAEVHLGRSQFAIANADDVVVFREQGMDVVAVLAASQDNPRCILVREESGVESFADLANKTLQRQAGRPFLEFMRAEGLLDKVREVPYHGSVAALVADPNVTIQAYSYSEPLLARQQGVQVRTLMVSDLGWNPYSSVLITSGQVIRDDPQLVRTFVEATRRGWQNYLTNPSLGNAAILSANKHGMTAETLEFGTEGLRGLSLPEGMPAEELGTMSSERWKALVDQMVALKLVDASKVKPEDCFTTEFL